MKSRRGGGGDQVHYVHWFDVRTTLLGQLPDKLTTWDVPSYCILKTGWRQEMRVSGS